MHFKECGIIIHFGVVIHLRNSRATDIKMIITKKNTDRLWIKQVLNIIPA